MRHNEELTSCQVESREGGGGGGGGGNGEGGGRVEGHTSHLQDTQRGCGE